MAALIRVFAFVAVLLCTVESLQIRKTLKLEGDEGPELVGDKPEVDGEREEVYDFFDQRYGQDEEDVRQEDFSDEQPDESEDPYDHVPNLIVDSLGGEDDMGGSETESMTTMKLPKTKDIPNLTLGPVTLSHGPMVVRVPWKGDSYDSIFSPGLATSAPSSGAEVTVVRDDLSSKAEASVRLFQKDGYSNGTCSPVDPTKVVNAYCGNHYLFPGYSMRLVSSEHCFWRFRHLSPEIVLSMKGLQLEKDFVFKVEERLVTSSVQMIVPKQGPRKLVPTKKLLREFVLTTPRDKTPAYVNAEICAPSGAGDLSSEYEGFETTCCSRSDSCGVPVVRNIIGHKLTMHALPWEAVLTVRGTPSSDTAETWCAGTLISSEWVLTTASCFIRNGLLITEGTDYVPEVIVAFGIKNDSLHDGALPVGIYDVQTHAVSEVHVFPTVSETHEVALVRLKEPSSRMPVCLPAYMRPHPARNLYNREALVFGWVVSDGKPYLNALKQKVISSDKCSTRLGRRLPPHMVCSIDTPGDRPCLADGHLLTVSNNRYFLSGLSWPRLQCTDDLRPHTSVAYFMNWITSVTGMAMPHPVAK